MEQEVRTVLCAVQHRDADSAKRWFELICLTYKENPEGGVAELIAAMRPRWPEADDLDTFAKTLESMSSGAWESVGKLAALDTQLPELYATAVAARAQAARPAAAPAEDVRELAWLTSAQKTALEAFVPSLGPVSSWLPGKLTEWWPGWAANTPEVLANWLTGAIPALGTPPPLEEPEPAVSPSADQAGRPESPADEAEAEELDDFLATHVYPALEQADIDGLTEDEIKIGLEQALRAGVGA